MALATPPGHSALAIIRASGPEVGTFLKRLANRNSFQPRHATLADLHDPSTGEKIDHCVVQFFPSPHSYTGEDLCEISCHGSPVLISRLLEAVLHLGARLAEPGEFTLRAFLNGKMDLAQAEAVRDLVDARTEYQARIAREQLEGKLSAALQPLKQKLVDVISFLETAVEFVEDDVGEISRSAQAENLQQICQDLQKMEASYSFGRFIHDGFQLAIIGRPNVGKSSLFNALLQSDRAIVTEIPGTTRDLITESMHVEGVPVRLIDTAGIRSSSDRIEQIGIERSHQAAGDADVLLVVLDATSPVTSEDEELLKRLQSQPGIVVWNKIDLAEPQQATVGRRPAVDKEAIHISKVSALKGEGLNELRQSIHRLLSQNAIAGQQGIIVTNLRHKICMAQTRVALEEGCRALRENLSEEFALYHIRSGLQRLGEITGETTVEDILDNIFSTFCIGK